MQKIILTVLICSFLTNSLLAQSQPKISNVRVAIDTAQKVVKITYDIENNKRTDSLLVRIERKKQPVLTKPPTIKGTVKDIPAGKNRVVYWDVVTDNFKFQEQINVHIYLNHLPPPRQIKPISPTLKWIGAGTLLASGISAFYIRNQFVSKRNGLETLLTKIDPDGDRLIPETDYAAWKTANQEVINARKQTLFNVLVGTAIVSGLFETYALFLRKKPIKETALSLRPARESLGLSLCYTFK